MAHGDEKKQAAPELHPLGTANKIVNLLGKPTQVIVFSSPASLLLGEEFFRFIHLFLLRARSFAPANPQNSLCSFRGTPTPTASPKETPKLATRQIKKDT